MRKIVSWALLFILSPVFIYLGYQNFWFGPCDKPLKYKIGRFDQKFGIDEFTFREEITKAESIWEKVANKDLFQYDRNAKFTINLVYDERQAATDLKRKTEFGLVDVENLFQKTNFSFEEQKKVYEGMVLKYNTATHDFNIRKTVYENEVKKWNNKGGAPEQIFNNLEKEREILNKMTLDLNEQVLKINSFADDLNLALQNRNAVAEQYNKIVREYNQKFGHGVEFNQAEYNSVPPAINLYQFTNLYDLRLALAHEFGHSLGFEHIENAKSIMYYRTKESSDSYGDLEATTEDMIEMKRVCKF